MDKTIILIAVACVIVIGLVLYLKKPTIIDNYEGTWKPDYGNKNCGTYCELDCSERFGEPVQANGQPVGPSFKGEVRYNIPTEKSLACKNVYCPKVCDEDITGSRAGYCLEMVRIGVPGWTQEKAQRRVKFANKCFLEPRIL